MRGIALAGALAASGLAPFAAGAAAAPDSGSSGARRWPVLVESRERVYIGWSVRDGARAGARVLVHDPNRDLPETLAVAWARDEISALKKPADPAFPGLALPARGAWAEPLDPVRPPRPSGALRVPLSQLPATLDPAHATSLAEKQVLVQVFEGLMRVGPSGLERALADSTGGDATARVYRLRSGARFHDGSPVRAADVVASLRRALAPATAAPRVEALLDAIAGARAFHDGAAPTLEGVEAPDSLHVRIAAAGDVDRVDGAVATLAASVLPAAQADHPGFAFMPVGTGPFRFVRADSTGVLLRAADGRSGGVDTLDFRRVSSPRDAALQFELGRLDLVSPRVEDEARLSLLGPDRLEVPEMATYYLGMNCRSGWLAQRANRRAVAAAIDRALLVRVLVAGRGVRAQGLLPWSLSENLPDSAWLPPAAEAARISRASAPAGGLSLWVPNTSETGLRVAEFVQAALGRRGLRVRIEARPWDEFERGLASGRADLYYLSWYADDYDAWRFLRALLASPDRGGEGNHAFYSNAAIDSAFAAGPPSDALATAAAEQLDKWPGMAYSRDFARQLNRIEARALADVPVLPLFHPVNILLVRPWVEGFVPHPLGCPRYDTVEIVRPAPRTAEGD